ncbi:Asperlicin C monooxygenase [Lasiodiplodia theobromae]|uniref:Asperlicin C monooxygenase n=1 Tax=Lasiodiplodia theobromae TaxID=45133 RepID=A0A5N5D0I3_9PEZI|nr:Asperlicin C monooxygenase [Lasiodiplodia theobromae]
MGLVNETLSTKRYPSSGLSALVIGGGIAGLSFAIEAYRKGHDVRIVDRRPNFDDYGDVIALQQSALKTPQQWSNFMERLRNVSIFSPLDMRKYDGTSVGQFPPTNPDYPSLVTTRSELHKLLYQYTQELGIAVEFNATVADYYETDEAGGVLLSDGRKLEADVVVAADGVGSKACLLVSGYKDRPSSSGSAVYRATYPVAVALQNPVIAEWLAGHDTYVAMFMGPDAYVVIGRTENTVCWVMTRKDDGEAEENWNKTAPTHKALDYVKGWAPIVQEMIKTTPNQSCTDWKLMWRDPQDSWIVGKFVGDWIVKHDPEAYVYENYGKCVNHLLMGAPFENTNAVPGYRYKPWTVSEVLKAYEENGQLADEGEW